MTRPLRQPPAVDPLRLYLRGERIAEVGIVDALRDAAADAQRRINKLETRHGIGSVVRRAQLAIVRRELREVQNGIWKAVGKYVRQAAPAIADAAAEAEETLQRWLFNVTGRRESEALVAAQRAYARRTVATFLARGQNGIGLSQRVYRTSQLANGFVDRAINRVILQGGSWQEMAAAVRPMISPDTPGGVSYAAKRLARTELNNAFHTTQKVSAEINPFVNGLRWNLGRSHRHEDRCDELARGHTKGRPSGVYVPSELPTKPHPQCLCYTTNEMVSEDEFLDMVTDPGFLENLTEEYEGTTVAALPKAAGDNVVALKPVPKPKPTPKKKPSPAKKPTIAQLSRRKPADTQRLGGATAFTDLVTYSDGSKLIHKVNGSRAQSADFDVVEITDAEELGAAVLGALGLRAAEVHRAGPAEVWMEYIDGEVGGKTNDRKQLRRLGLADHGMVQFDRNEGNWIKDKDGNIVGIDNGSAWLEGADKSRSEFAEFIYKSGKVDIHPADVEEAIRRAEKLRPQFKRLNKSHWLDATIGRYQELRGRASESAERIFP